MTKQCLDTQQCAEWKINDKTMSWYLTVCWSNDKQCLDTQQCADLMIKQCLDTRPATAPTLGTISSEADDKVFVAIALNPLHLLHHLLPPRHDTHYSLRHTTVCWAKEKTMSWYLTVCWSNDKQCLDTQQCADLMTNNVLILVVCGFIILHYGLVSVRLFEKPRFRFCFFLFSAEWLLMF